MSDLMIALAIIGGIAGNVVLIAGVVIPAARWLDKRLDRRITTPVAELQDKVTARFDQLDEKVDGAVTKLDSHDRRINWVEQRTAGLEGKVFGRPPLLDEEGP